MTALPERKTPPKRTGRWRITAVAVGVAAIALLSKPEPSPAPPAGAGQPIFEWRQDAVWSQLEARLVESRTLDAAALTARIDPALTRLQSLVGQLTARPHGPTDDIFGDLESQLFQLGPLLAAHPARLNDYIEAVTRARSAVKDQSRAWDLGTLPARQRLYRLLYGSRLALETVMLQVPPDTPLAELVRGDDEPSVTPSATLLGMKLHSGDILVSRGAAPTSSLIARGNDYPGAFSHVALVHVDPSTREVLLVEALIERGVVVTTLDEYLEGKKLRVMLLRPRADLPALVADPMRPHQAAAAALAAARRRHIPYDFAMDHHDPRAQFCSEVASAAYASVGLSLWMGVSYVSSPTLTAWLGSIGVRHFETQEPADLEYDPQLRLVAEWRGRTTLFNAHVDDAATDVLIEQAPPGVPLPYSHAQLPLARLAKGYSALLNLLGRTGPIPQGLSATAALRVERYREDHQALVGRLLARAEAFRKERGYLPPYWELVRLARELRQAPAVATR